MGVLVVSLLFDPGKTDYNERIYKPVQAKKEAT